MRPVLRLENITVNDRERVGGKGFALATMVKIGFKVPDGVCSGVDAYNRYLAETGLGARILMELDRKDFADMAARLQVQLSSEFLFSEFPSTVGRDKPVALQLPSRHTKVRRTTAIAAAS
jgi:phosphoenolpyruvate synthase/pyruvate phosphate dikinase